MLHMWDFIYKIWKCWISFKISMRRDQSWERKKYGYRRCMCIKYIYHICVSNIYVTYVHQIYMSDKYMWGLYISFWKSWISSKITMRRVAFEISVSLWFLEQTKFYIDIRSYIYMLQICIRYICYIYVYQIYIWCIYM